MICDRNDRIDASLLSDLPCFKNDVIVDVDELNNASDNIECLIIGNDCLNELNEIDLSRFVNVRMIDVGVTSLQKVESLVISISLIIDCSLIDLIFLSHYIQYRRLFILLHNKFEFVKNDDI